MYLSRLKLTTQRREARTLLIDCHAMHRMVMSGFPAVDEGGPARAALNVLHRVQSHPHGANATVFVQSDIEPDWRALEQRGLLAEWPESKPVGPGYEAIGDGDMLRFSLVANPSRKLSDRTRKNSKRVQIFDERERYAWLAQKAEQHGFLVPDLEPAPATDDGIWGEVDRGDWLARGDIPATRMHPLPDLTGTKENGVRFRLTIAPVQYDGVLRVTDADRFRAALRKGIGPAKAFGCGFMLVTRTG